MIKFRQFKTPLRNALLAERVAPQEAVVGVLDFIEKFLDHHLICSECGDVFDDEAFYKCKIQTGRRGRSTVCKVCYKSYLWRRKGKGVKK